MIYLIKKIGYDESENHNPLYEQIEGYCDTVEEAALAHSRLTAAYPLQHEYGGELYPQIRVVPVEKIV